jgi:flagellar biosynthetic protein FliR
MSALAYIHELLLKLNITTDPQVFLTIFTLAVARIGAALPFIPFLGGDAVPAQVQITLSMLIAGVLYPALSAQTGGVVPHFPEYVAYLAKELMIGCLIGIMIKIVFTAVEGAGSLMEFTASLKPDEIFAPQLPTATGPLSRFFGQAAVVLYLTAGVHLLFLQALADSYGIVPLLAFPAFRPGFLPLAELAGRIAGGFITVAFQLAAPVILLLVLMQIGSNLVFRMSFAGVKQDPLQPLATLALYGSLFMAFAVMAAEIVRQSLIYLDQIRGFMRGLR